MTSMPDLRLWQRLYREMLRIRMVEERIAELYPEQQMRCPVHLCIGQEAIAVGVCAHLTRYDYAMSGHRSHGHYLAKGGDLKAMLAEIYGKATGCSRGKGGSMHLVDLDAGFLGATPIVASTIPIGVGAAFGTVLKGESRVSVVFFGEAATEEGVFYEAVNFAVLKRLPVVFVCENNLYSVYSPLSVRQPLARDLCAIAQGEGCPASRANGNDVLEVHRLAGEAVGRARAGAGPTLLELSTYRWREHCGPHYDNDIGYRTEAEFREWHAKCPIVALETRLIQAGSVAQKDLERMRETLSREIEEAEVFAKTSPFPADVEWSEGVYAP